MYIHRYVWACIKCHCNYSRVYLVSCINKRFIPFPLHGESMYFNKMSHNWNITPKIYFWGISSQSKKLFKNLTKTLSLDFQAIFCLSLCLYYVILQSYTLFWLMFFAFFSHLNRGSLGQWMLLGVKVPHRQACLPSANLQIWSSGTLGISKEKWQLKKYSEYPHFRCKHLNPSAIFNLPE